LSKEAARPAEELLAVKGLEVSLGPEKKRKRILRGISFSMKSGECLGMVGESGCGKTLTALSILRLLSGPGGRIDGGEILFKGEDLARAPERRLRDVRGREVALIFQDALSAMNPYIRVSEQLVEGLAHHKGTRKSAALEQAVAMMRRVGIPAAGERVHDYPHQFSGGMLQRIMIAMALLPSPDLVIADEPTSALDVTIQAQTLKLMDELRASLGTAVLLITHDLGLVAGRTDRIAVMYSGRIVEYGGTAAVLKGPGHPYLQALLASNPALDRARAGRLQEIPGRPPGPGEVPAGCPFAPRCPEVLDRCRRETPPLIDLGEGHSAACWRNRSGSNSST
jgi:oligopeptide transport system ATP-binding protein